MGQREISQFSPLQSKHTFLLGISVFFFFFKLKIFFIATCSRRLRLEGDEVGRSRGPVSSCLYQAPGTALTGATVMNELDLVWVRAHVTKDHLSPGEEFGFPFKGSGKTLSGLCRMQSEVIDGLHFVWISSGFGS